MLAGYWSWILTTSMMRRWLYHYELSNAIVRLVTLTAINWSISAFINSHYGPDAPIWIWMTICFILLVSNVLKIVLASSPKYNRKVEDVQEPRINHKSTVVKVLILPLFVVILLTMFSSMLQIDRLRYTSSQLMKQEFKLATAVDMAVFGQATVKVMIVVLSSWTPKGFEKRQVFRNTTMKLLPKNSDRISFTYRFILGEAPSAKASSLMGPSITKENEMYNDILIVPSSDLYNDLSRKVYKALEWTNDYNYDFLVKTDDDIFVRWDTISQELATLGPQRFYWRGLGYWNIPPIKNSENKNAAFDYQLPMFPPFTAGALYILSRDVVNAIVGTPGPRLYTKNEDQNLGIWLFPYNIKPIHDRRIQQADVCEDDMIAKHFGDSYEIGGTMYDMLNNIENNKRLCAGFKTNLCALCYPCRGKANHWKDWNFDCDDTKGVTLLHQPEMTLVTETVKQVKDKAEISVLGKNDDWIIKGLLTQLTSTYSESDNWHLLHWVCWTTDPSTFTDRHWRTLELIWVHQPRAVVFMLTTTLTDNFFDEYKRNGYNIHVVHFNKDLLLKYRWYLGPDSHSWLRDWDKWEKGPYFFSHLTDYMRYLLIYKYGGTYMDMDALWIRSPPDDNLEFIGADYATLKSDADWTLDSDGMYLAPGVMRFRKGWTAFKDIAEAAFSPSYNPACFNCVGPRAITIYVKNNRKPMEAAGFTIVPNNVLYPVNYIEVHRLLEPDALAEHELRNNIMVKSWSIHLFGKMTNHLPVQSGSVVDLVFRKFDLDIPHTDTATHNIISSTGHMKTPFTLVGPKNYIYRTSSATDKLGISHADALQQIPGTFQGMDVIFVRGGPAKSRFVTMKLSVTNGKLRIGAANGSDFAESILELRNVTKKDVNALLNSIMYTPSANLAANGGHDNLHISVEYGDDTEHVSASIDVKIYVSEVDGSSF